MHICDKMMTMMKFTTMHICSKTHWPAQEPEIACPLVHHPGDSDSDSDSDSDADHDDNDSLIDIHTPSCHS